MSGTTPRGAVLYCTLCALMFTSSACSSTKFKHVWTERYLVARSAHDRGRHDEAEGHYKQLLKHAPNTEMRRLVQVSEADLARDRGQHEEAFTRYTRIWQASYIDEHGAKAMYRAAQYTEQRDGAAAAIALKRKLVVKYPVHVWAERALEDVIAYDTERGEAKALDRQLTEWAAKPSIKKSPLAPHILLRHALLCEETLKDDARALKLLTATYKNDPEGPLADDALWERARIYERRVEWTLAVKELEKIANIRESSWFVGTYDSQYADDARYKIGLIYRDHLKKPAVAIQQFKLFIRDFPESILRDDAAWALAETRCASEGRAACKEAMRAFAKEYPKSRHARKVKDHL